MKEKQIEFVKAQISDIEYLIEKADKGYEVGDVMKLEARKEQLENKLTKLLGGQEDVKELDKEELDALELYKLRNRIEELESKKHKRKYILLAIGLFVWMTIVAIIGVYNSNKINIDEANQYKIKSQEMEQQNYCYKVLYNEDEIGNGCEKYFEDDAWYQEYLEANKIHLEGEK